MATIDNLSIQVTASAESAASALDRLASSAGGLRGAAARAGGGLRDLSAGAKDAGTATQEAGQQAGNAERHTRDYGRAAQEAGNAAKRGTAGIATFWEALKRVAYYRFVRTIIKAITASFKEGLTHLYQYSNAINGHFAKSLDNLATSTLYLKNSLGTLAAPLIEALAPALEWIIDKIVEVINFFNMFVAAISGKSSYTAAVKVATTATAEWGKETTKTTKTAKESIDELKRTILGFDEINKLDKDKIIGGSGGSGSGAGSGGTGPSPSSMFEERPLEGFFKDLSGITRGWPDWLKWLFGIGAVAIGAWGISLLPKLIGKIWDALKRLFGITIPDWFKWLFGPKDDNNPGIDIPDHIDIPDGKIKVDVEKGDWSALNELTNKTIPVSMEKSWKNTPLEWLGLDNLSATVTIAMVKSWKVAALEWLGLNNLSATVTIAMVKSWKVAALEWLGLNNLSTNVNVKLVKSGWTTLAKYVGTYEPNVYVKLVKSGWDSLASYVGEYTANVKVVLEKYGWTDISSYLDDNFGGASGGGGKTSGGGAGRGRHGGGGGSYGVEIGLHEGWTGTPQEALGINDLKSDVSVGINPIWSLISGILVYLGIKNLTANIYITLSTQWGNAGIYSWKNWIGYTSDIYSTLHVSVSTQWGDHGVYSWKQWIGYESDIYTTQHVRTVQENAAGGVVTANGSWSFASGGVISNGIAKRLSNIPHYAGGTRDAHGTLFLAGEAGPEIVGHVGGRTEILNQSQLAQTMFAAVRSAMTGVRIGGYIENAVPDGGSEADYEAMYRAMYDAFTDAMAGNNERDREKVQLMREIAAKEFTAEVTAASMNRAQTRMNRRAGTTIVPVGT